MSGVDDDLWALERKQMPVTSHMAELWAQDILRVQGYLSTWQRQQDDELRWLRQSLEDDFLPDWCIRLVLENWRKEQVNRAWPLIRE